MSTEQTQPLIIRADANTQIGTGHLMRCLALAQAWQAEGGQALFVTACDSSALQRRLLTEGCELKVVSQAYPETGDWPTLASVLAANPGAWVVLDGYHFNAAYQQRIRAAGHRLLVIDDMAHLPYYEADIVLNQNIHAGELQYTCEPTTHLLLGTKYALLRREFWPWRGWQREIPSVAQKVLVTMGGSDPDNVTLKVIQALAQLTNSELEAVVVVGAPNHHWERLQEAVANAPIPIRLVRNSTEMAELMAWADVAVSAAGSSCWELSFLGLPALLLVLADNQQPVAQGMARAGAMINLGWHDAVEAVDIAYGLQELLPEARKRRKFSEKGRDLVDGSGAAAVVRQLRTEKLTLREVRAEDCYLLWEWANDPVTRMHSFSPELIPWEGHVAWFAAKVADPGTRFYVALNAQGEPVGYVRFQLTDQAEAVISMAVAPSQRGRGFGSQVICLGAQAVWQSAGVTVVHAYIKPDNPASQRAFAKAGFAQAGVRTVNGDPAFHFVRQRQE